MSYIYVQDGLSQTSCLSMYELNRHKIIRQQYITITLPLLAALSLYVAFMALILPRTVIISKGKQKSQRFTSLTFLF
jgi:hypothetical protein